MGEMAIPFNTQVSEESSPINEINRGINIGRDDAIIDMPDGAEPQRLQTHDSLGAQNLEAPDPDINNDAMNNQTAVPAGNFYLFIYIITCGNLTFKKPIHTHV